MLGSSLCRWSSLSYLQFMDSSVRQQCDKIWEFRVAHAGREPVRSRHDDHENLLAVKKSKLSSRCNKALGSKPSERELMPEEVAYFKWCLSADALHSAEEPSATRKPANQPALSPRKRLRQKSSAPAAPGLCHSAAGGSSIIEQATSTTTPAAPGLCPSAAESHDSQPLRLAQQLTLRGLNIQYPFSQLMLLGAKTIEARTFPLGHRKIANASEELFLIETPGPKNVHGAIVDDLPVGPPPQHAQVVGTVSFSSSQPYGIESEWKNDRHQHRIKEGGRYDWNGTGEMHAWHVDKVRRFSAPVDAGTKSQVGYGTPRTLDVTLPSVQESS
jgi:hypothetical protein